jgi:hypothetical protein
MVFTVTVRNGVGRGALSRRAVLSAAGGSALLLVAGCDVLRGAVTAESSPDPLEPLLAGTLALLDRYDAALSAAPDLAERLGPIRDDHRAHADALAHLTGASPSRVAPSAAPSTTPDGADLSSLRDAETTGHTDAVNACLAAPADRAGLLGSIAACRATHVQALR